MKKLFCDILNIDDKNIQKKIFKHFLLSFLLVYAIMLYINPFLIKGFNDWDIEWYRKIMKNGYDEISVVFFPLFPIVMKIFNLFKIPIIGSILFNNLLCFLTCILFYKISIDIYNQSKETAFNIILLFLYSPIRLYTSIPYTESLFIFLCTLSFYLYKKRMNPYILGITIGLSVATRNVGSIWFFVLFIMFVIDFFKNNKKEKIIYIIKTYIPATIISCLYPLYLQFKFGNWKMFLDSQFEYWGRKSDKNIFEILFSDFNLLDDNTYLSVKLTVLFTFITLFFVIVLIFNSLKYDGTKKIELILFLLINIIICLTSYRHQEGCSMAGTCSFYRYIYGTISMYLLLPNNAKIGFYFIINLLMLIIATCFFVSPFFLC